MRRAAAAFAFVLFSQGAALAAPSWEPLSFAIAPSPRDGHGMAALESGQAALFGGYGPSGFLGDLWILSPSGWEMIPGPGPAPRYAHGMAAEGDVLWVFGGYAWPGYRPTDDLWKFAGGRWRKADAQGPPARIGPAMAASGGKVYVYGGLGSAGIFGDFWEFDPSFGTWRQLSADPGPRALSAMAAGPDGRLWLFGGLRPPYRLGDTWIYDPASGRWSEAGRGPEGRFWHSMAAGPDGGIWLFGGAKANWGHWLSDTWRLDPETGVWERIYASGPSARAGAAMAAFGGGILLFGGLGDQGITGDAWLLRPDPVLRVKIDVRPGSDENPVNLGSRGLIPAAVLSGPDFDAPGEVDAGSLTFGRTGEEPSLERCLSDPEDVDGDGLLDLLCHFRTEDAGFEPGDERAVLRGRTLSGRKIEGWDRIKIVGAPSLRVRAAPP